MHGLKQFVVSRHGADAWKAMVDSAGAKGWYLHNETYPDEELGSLISAGAAQFHVPEAVLVEEFGLYIVPSLFQFYGAFVSPQWRTFELLANAENVIHQSVRARNPDVKPPHLNVQLIDSDEIHILYDSPRRLCALAIGICRGVALHYTESITVEQPECMRSGAQACRLVVKRVTPSH